MIKKLLSIVLVLMLSFFAAGCNKEDSGRESLDINMVAERLNVKENPDYVDHSEIISLFLNEFGNAAEYIGVTEKAFSVDEGAFGMYEVFAVYDENGATGVYLVPVERTVLYIYEYNADDTLALVRTKK